MIGAIVGAVTSAASSIIGGAKNRKAMRESAKKLEEEKAANQAWYDRRYNEDATQRADARRMLTRTEEAIKNRNRSAAGTRSVTGGTDESVAGAQEAEAGAMADAASQIAAAGAASKDAVEQQYRNTQMQIADKESQNKVAKAKNIAGAIQGVAATAGNIASAFDGSLKKEKKEEE